MLFRILLGAVVVAGLIQLIPYGREHTNPAVVLEPTWDSPQTRELARRACFDCHSHQTTWPWYSSVAPVSWLTQRDVNGGRRHLNFSEWNQPQRHAKDVVEQTESGEMPPWFYLPTHPEARLTPAERAALVAGFKKMTGFEKSPRP
jgi:mono/diheme cytochrome c family protein